MEGVKVAKRYSRRTERPTVGEAKTQPYGRGKNRRQGSQLALSVAAVKRRLKKPVKRSKREIAWALEIAGIGEGPTNLSEKTRKYLSGDR